MKQKEVKRLSRRELVDIIYQLKKNEQAMQEEVDALKQQLEDKRLRIAEAGTIANAAVDIAQVFAAAQNAADLYLREIEAMKQDAQRQCEQLLEDARMQAAQMLAPSAAEAPAPPAVLRPAKKSKSKRRRK